MEILVFKKVPGAMEGFLNFKPINSITFVKTNNGPIYAYETGYPDSTIEMPIGYDFAILRASWTNIGWTEVSELTEMEKCECGSGNNTRCQNHSTWCKLYTKGA